ncbi:hypothetical protein [Pelagibaculum spongiae]|uniref:Uncharacterized protein n=1 Tax=Pelagibaculum spongiae TaxID=2080658 RepID=A0A2V1H2M0_9GAMM|nr:hypothetical protein [Pelagibaculum spongiae]PVZ70259.1 hypothetical protein DC094_06580 [Pelagibaculum spongiae]
MLKPKTICNDNALLWKIGQPKTVYIRAATYGAKTKDKHNIPANMEVKLYLHMNYFDVATIADGMPYDYGSFTALPPSLAFTDKPIYTCVDGNDKAIIHTSADFKVFQTLKSITRIFNIYQTFEGNDSTPPSKLKAVSSFRSEMEAFALHDTAYIHVIGETSILKIISYLKKFKTVQYVNFLLSDFVVTGRFKSQYTRSNPAPSFSLPQPNPEAEKVRQQMIEEYGTEHQLQTTKATSSDISLADSVPADEESKNAAQLYLDTRPQMRARSKPVSAPSLHRRQGAIRRRS